MNTTTSPAMPRISVSEAAAIYLKKGMMPLPLYFRRKNPSVPDWRNFRLTPDTIKNHFGASDNIGIITGLASGSLGCIDLDSDIARRLAPTYLPETGLIAGRGNSPGGHWFYLTNGHLPGRKWNLSKADAEKFGFAHTVELLGDGQQVVVGPSVHHTGDLYDLLNGPPAEVDGDKLIAACEALDQAVRKELGIAPQPQPRNKGHTLPRNNSHPHHRYDSANILDRAAKYLARIPPAVSGQCGHDATFHTAGVLVQGFALTVDDAMPLLAEWNTRCQPPWSEAELKHKLEDAAKAPGPRGALLGPPQKAQSGTPRAGNGYASAGAARTTSPPEPITPVSAAKTAMQYPRLRPVVIDGLARQGETINVISASKMGKSWFVYLLIFAIVTGRRWLDRFDCVKGRVLLIDNELHAPTLANRLDTVATALGLADADWRDSLDIISSRGAMIDIETLAPTIEAIDPGKYAIVVADALYRFWPRGISENDNGDVTQVYNRIDQYAEHLGAAWLNIHHASKGDQSGKSVVDVGSGAGAQSRAADTHLVLRPHEKRDVVVLEAAVRSFSPVAPVSLRWSYPLWRRDDAVDPRKLRGSAADDQRLQKDEAAKADVMRALASADRALSKSDIAAATGIGRFRLDRLLPSLLKHGRITASDVTIRGNPTSVYAIGLKADPAPRQKPEN